MTVVVHNITAIPTGIDYVKLYKCYIATGVYVYEQSVAVVSGQTSITFNATDGYYYKFTLCDSVTLSESILSPSYIYVPSVNDSNLCRVYDTITDGNGPVDGAVVTITVQGIGVKSSSGDSVVMEPITVTSGDPSLDWPSGYWEVTLDRSATLTPVGTPYLIVRKGKKFKDAKLVVIPEITTIRYVDLISPPA